MDIAVLALFADVARRGSFSEAARSRGLDASSVSRAIGALEREVGARLFQRSTRRLALTEAGQLYLDRIGPALEVLVDAREEAAALQGEVTGTLRLTASAAFGQLVLAPHLSDLRAAFPRLRLELLLSDVNLDLVAEGIDLAVRLAPSFRADVVGVRLFPTRYRVVAAPAWLRHNGAPREPADLKGHSCLLFALPDYRTRWLFRKDAKVVEVAVTGDLVAASALFLRQAAVDGHGPALLADWMIKEDLDCGRLIDLFPDHEAAATTFDTAAWLLYPSRQHLPRKVRLVADFLRSRLGRR